MSELSHLTLDRTHIRFYDVRLGERCSSWGKGRGVGKFQFSALSADGQTVDGTEVAETIGEVHQALLARHLVPIQVQPKRSLLQYEITKKKVPPRDLMHFSRQLSVFFRAGIPVLQALEVISSEMANKEFKLALEDMIERLRGGSTVSAAAALHPEAFPAYYLGILRSAEVTGNLDVVLEQLADYIERDLETRQKITAALLYPAIVMGLAVVTILVLTIFVLPRFQTFFDDFNAELPLPTRMLVSFSKLSATYGPIVVGIGLVVFIGLVAFGKTDAGREKRDRLILRIPVVGSLVSQVIVERFCRIFGSMLTAGVSVPEALSVTSQATNNRVFQAGIAEAREAMMRGDGLAGPLAATGLFPSSANQMFRVGEDTGTFDKQLATAATYLDRELDYSIKRATGYFEPAVILFIGVVVGFVAVALVSAMYGLYNQTEA